MRSGVPTCRISSETTSKQKDPIMSEGEKTVATWGYLIPRDCHAMLATHIDNLVRAERERCVRIITTQFVEARDTDFDLGFETARKVFSAAIRNR